MSGASNSRKLEFVADAEMTVEQLLKQNGFSKTENLHYYVMGF